MAPLLSCPHTLPGSKDVHPSLLTDMANKSGDWWLSRKRLRANDAQFFGKPRITDRDGTQSARTDLLFDASRQHQ